MNEIIPEQIYKVLVRTDNAGKVVEINSSAFISSLADWVQIDSGYGDRYHHAQGNYLPGPLMDEHGVYRYKLVDGAVHERTQEEMDADFVALLKPEDPDYPGRIETLENCMTALMEGINDA